MPLSKHAERRVIEIMEDGKERTYDEICDIIMRDAEKYNEVRISSNRRTAKIIVPTRTEMGSFARKMGYSRRKVRTVERLPNGMRYEKYPVYYRKK